MQLTFAEIQVIINSLLDVIQTRELTEKEKEVLKKLRKMKAELVYEV